MCIRDSTKANRLHVGRIVDDTTTESNRIPSEIESARTQIEGDARIERDERVTDAETDKVIVRG